jgi:formylglycine-generating enzyme required for sulfatase activity
MLPGPFGVRGDDPKPNDFGLFNMLGNALEWVQDGFLTYQGGEDKESKDLLIGNQTSRVLRGSSVLSPASNVRSAYRCSSVPTYRGITYGFRAARTFR